MDRHVAVNFLPPHVQKRTKLDEPGIIRGRESHAGESLKAGPPAKIANDGFRLILGMMRQEDVRCAMLPRHALKESISLHASAGLDGQFPLPCQQSDVRAVNLARDTERGRELQHETRISIRLRTAQTMIQVTENETPPPLRYKEMEKHHRVPPAGNADECWLVRAKLRVGNLQCRQNSRGLPLPGESRRPPGIRRL